MKKAIIFSLLFALCPSVYAHGMVGNPFVYETGKLSLGVVGAEADVYYDIFKHTDDITARVGASITFLKYDRYSLFAGIGAPTSMPSSVAAMGGPAADFSEEAKNTTKCLLEALPFNLTTGTIDEISSAIHLKVYAGYDFRAKGTTAGVALGKGFGK